MMKSKTKNFVMATAAGAAAAPASGAINYVDLGAGVSAIAGDVIHFSLSEEWAANDTAPSQGGERFVLDFYFDESGKPNIEGYNSGEVASADGYAKKFSESCSISSSESFLTSSLINNDGGNDANWPAGTRGFIGLKFDNAGTDNFGWADVEYASDESLNLYGFAYDDSGAAIDAGAIPEPRAAALLAALAAGSAAMMSRRRAACVDA